MSDDLRSIHITYKQFAIFAFSCLGLVVAATWKIAEWQGSYGSQVQSNTKKIDILDTKITEVLETKVLVSTVLKNQEDDRKILTDINKAISKVEQELAVSKVKIGALEIK